MDGNWLPNPYALAQVLTDKLDLDALYDEDGKSADLFLNDAFKAHGKGKTLADLLGLFHRLAEAVKAPMPIAEVMNLAEAKQAAEVFRVPKRFDSCFLTWCRYRMRSLPDLQAAARPERGRALGLQIRSN